MSQAVVSVDDVGDAVSAGPVQLEPKVCIVPGLLIQLVDAGAGWGCWHPSSIKLHMHRDCVLLLVQSWI